MIGYIYKLTCNGDDFYVGKTEVGLNERYRTHLKAFTSNENNSISTRFSDFTNRRHLHRKISYYLFYVMRFQRNA